MRAILRALVDNGIRKAGRPFPWRRRSVMSVISSSMRSLDRSDGETNIWELWEIEVTGFLRPKLTLCNTWPKRRSVATFDLREAESILIVIEVMDS